MNIYESPGIVVRKRNGETEYYKVSKNPTEGQLITCNFIDMLNGDDSGICDGYDGQTCLLAMEAVKLSDREGRKITVRNIG